MDEWWEAQGDCILLECGVVGYVSVIEKSTGVADYNVGRRLRLLVEAKVF